MLRKIYIYIGIYHHLVLTHWGWDKMATIFQTIFSNAFSWMKMFEFRLEFHRSLFFRFQLTISQHWFRKWLGTKQATSHYLNQWLSISLTHICATRPQWIDAGSGNRWGWKSRTCLYGIYQAHANWCHNVILLIATREALGLSGWQP